MPYGRAGCKPGSFRGVGSFWPDVRGFEGGVIVREGDGHPGLRGRLVEHEAGRAGAWRLVDDRGVLVGSPGWDPAPPRAPWLD